MAMPEFISNVERGAGEPGSGWLTPATVADLSDTDFTALAPAQRAELYRAAERFRAIAEGGSPSPEQTAEARSSLDRILEILRPYRTPESRKIREAVWKVWKDHRSDIPTFDYELAQSWIDTPIVWIWLVLRDDLDIDAPPTRELLSRVRMAIREQFHEDDIERRPNIGIRMESEVKELAARKSA
jgi:hypothetical protein